MHKKKLVYPIPQYHDGRRFYNQDKARQVEKSLLSVLRWKITEKAAKWPDHIPNTHTPQLPSMIGPNEVFITMINHATLLIQMHNFTVLTDPVFSKRVSPFSWLGPKRHRAPGLAITDLPPIDVVLVSHNHYDHMDLASLKIINQRYQPLFVVPLKNAATLHSVNINNVVELAWWGSHHVNAQHNITLVPAQHWSGRGLLDRSRALWGGFVISADDLQIYFAGDTGYNSHFKNIKEQFSAIDISIVPIGSYEPRWFMKEQHLNPTDAVRAHLDLEAKLSIGMHFGTFQLTDEAFDAPFLALQEALEINHLSAADFVALDNGRTIHYRKGSK
jgi:L-ascorbate metabolism protein UlaG (beta-lactamase superfamily)